MFGSRCCVLGFKSLCPISGWTLEPNCAEMSGQRIGMVSHMGLVRPILKEVKTQLQETNYIVSFCVLLLAFCLYDSVPSVHTTRPGPGEYARHGLPR